MKHTITAKVTYRPTEGKCIALANITIDDDFVISGVKLLEGSKGEFISMPQRQSNNGEYFDIAFPLSGELRDQICDAVIEALHDDEGQEAPKPKNRERGTRRDTSSRRQGGNRNRR